MLCRPRGSVAVPASRWVRCRPGVRRPRRRTLGRRHWPGRRCRHRRTGHPERRNPLVRFRIHRAATIPGRCPHRIRRPAGTGPSRPASPAGCPGRSAAVSGRVAATLRRGRRTPPRRYSKLPAATVGRLPQSGRCRASCSLVSPPGPPTPRHQRGPGRLAGPARRTSPQPLRSRRPAGRAPRRCRRCPARRRGWRPGPAPAATARSEWRR